MVSEQQEKVVTELLQVQTWTCIDVTGIIAVFPILILNTVYVILDYRTYSISVYVLFRLICGGS